MASSTKGRSLLPPKQRGCRVYIRLFRRNVVHKCCVGCISCWQLVCGSFLHVAGRVLDGFPSTQACHSPTPWCEVLWLGVASCNWRVAVGVVGLGVCLLGVYKTKPYAPQDHPPGWGCVWWVWGLVAWGIGARVRCTLRQCCAAVCWGVDTIHVPCSTGC